MKKFITVLILVCFIATGQIGICPVLAQDFLLPKPGVMVHLSPPMNPPMLKGIKVHANDPFRFEFVLDQGDDSSPEAKGALTKGDYLKQESAKLIKYFLASLTIPEKDLWVNLSPYEKNRIVPESFGQTEMGRDLLAEDYMLKQITASLIYPEDEIGKKFWKRIYEEAQAKYHTTNIPVNTFNKVWIVPEKAVVYENAKAGTAYVVESRLKVMLEEDYEALNKNIQKAESPKGITPEKNTHTLGSQIIREVVIPELTKEINEGQNFAQLRQVYNSLILATWYKKKIKDSVLSQVYADKSKVQGVNIEDPQEKEKIYQQYLQAFKKGVYNYIKEEPDLITKQPIPKKYFSGGLTLSMAMMATTSELTIQLPSKAMAVSVVVQPDKAKRTESSPAMAAPVFTNDVFEIPPGANLNEIMFGFTGSDDSAKHLMESPQFLYLNPGLDTVKTQGGKIVFPAGRIFKIHRTAEDTLKTIAENFYGPFYTWEPLRRIQALNPSIVDPEAAIPLDKVIYVSIMGGELGSYLRGGPSCKIPRELIEDDWENRKDSIPVVGTGDVKSRQRWIDTILESINKDPVLKSEEAKIVYEPLIHELSLWRDDVASGNLEWAKSYWSSVKFLVVSSKAGERSIRLEQLAQALEMKGLTSKYEAIKDFLLAHSGRLLEGADTIYSVLSGIKDRAMNTVTRDQIQDLLGQRLKSNGEKLFLDASSESLRFIKSGKYNNVFDYGNSVIRVMKDDDERIFETILENILHVANLGRGPKILSAGRTANGEFYIQVEKVADGHDLSEGEDFSPQNFQDICEMLQFLIQNHLTMFDPYLTNFMRGTIKDRADVWLTDAEVVYDKNDTVSFLVAHYKSKIRVFAEQQAGGWNARKADRVIQFLEGIKIAEDRLSQASNDIYKVIFTQTEDWKQFVDLMRLGRRSEARELLMSKQNYQQFQLEPRLAVYPGGLDLRIFDQFPNVETVHYFNQRPFDVPGFQEDQLIFNSYYGEEAWAHMRTEYLSAAQQEDLISDGLQQKILYPNEDRKKRNDPQIGMFPLMKEDLESRGATQIKAAPLQEGVYEIAFIDLFGQPKKIIYHQRFLEADSDMSSFEHLLGGSKADMLYMKAFSTARPLLPGAIFSEIKPGGLFVTDTNEANEDWNRGAYFHKFRKNLQLIGELPEKQWKKFGYKASGSVFRLGNSAMTTDELVDEDGRLDMGVFDDLIKRAAAVTNRSAGLKVTMDVFIDQGHLFFDPEQLTLLFIPHDRPNIHDENEKQIRNALEYLYIKSFRINLEKILSKIEGYRSQEETQPFLRTFTIHRKSKVGDRTIAKQIKLDMELAPLVSDTGIKFDTVEEVVLDNVTNGLIKYLRLNDQSTPQAIYDAIRAYITAEFYLGDLLECMRAKNRLNQLYIPTEGKGQAHYISPSNRIELKKLFQLYRPSVLQLIASARTGESLELIRERLRLNIKEFFQEEEPSFQNVDPIQVTTQHGIHWDIAVDLVKRAQEYPKARIFLEHDGKSVRMTSVVNLMSLGVSEGKFINIKIYGVNIAVAEQIANRIVEVLQSESEYSNDSNPSQAMIEDDGSASDPAMTFLDLRKSYVARKAFSLIVSGGVSWGVPILYYLKTSNYIGKPLSVFSALAVYFGVRRVSRLKIRLFNVTTSGRYVITTWEKNNGLSVHVKQNLDELKQKRYSAYRLMTKDLMAVLREILEDKEGKFAKARKIIVKSHLLIEESDDGSPADFSRHAQKWMDIFEVTGEVYQRSIFKRTTLKLMKFLHLGSGGKSWNGRFELDISTPSQRQGLLNRLDSAHRDYAMFIDNGIYFDSNLRFTYVSEGGMNDRAMTSDGERSQNPAMARDVAMKAGGTVQTIRRTSIMNMRTDRTRQRPAKRMPLRILKLVFDLMDIQVDLKGSRPASPMNRLIRLQDTLDRISLFKNGTPSSLEALDGEKKELLGMIDQLRRDKDKIYLSVDEEIEKIKVRADTTDLQKATWTLIQNEFKKDRNDPNKAIALMSQYYVDGKINLLKDEAMKTQEKTKTGGIDLSSNQFLQTQNAGQDIQFHLDPAKLEELKNAPGFIPVIISIQPVSDLRAFLGIT